MEVAVTAGVTSRAKLQSNHHHQQTNAKFLQAGCPSCRPTNSIKVKGTSVILAPIKSRIFPLLCWNKVAVIVVIVLWLLLQPE